MSQPQRFGKFEVRRRLGSGGQSAVYLAHDPDLRRDVAIKLLKPGAAGAEAVRREARTVSQLRHRNIVPIHEMGEHQNRIYLVFEYVEGRTLQQALAQDGAIAPRRAAEMLNSILDALAEAHDKGVIHRDLKPSNILLDGAGEPHVMDFGIASAPTRESGLEGDLYGSPAYMAPEYVKSRSISEQYDVFSAGLILYEMVCGRRAVQGDNPYQALHQIANMPLTFPAGAVEAIGPVLHDIIVKATAKEPELRYASVKQMHDALDAYLNPAADAAVAQAAKASTLEFLLRRMKVKGDFPAMSSAMSAIQRIAASNHSNVSSLASAILKDYALTNKILRLVNSAYYANRSRERIRTVTRAIVMMGFDAVRSIAISLMLFDRIRDKNHAGALKEEFLRANLAGILARELCARINPSQSEEAFICALFHNLGRLLTCYYFWEESEAIRALVAQGTGEDAAAVRVLGIGYTELGMGVAESWGFPASITQSMLG
ncbi:MAG TPA: HDOD domain-containing protein, partial [Nevskiaceae bacterium]|nr:HDOD domain-containing protein [Nevskiaceae bacterium]